MPPPASSRLPEPVAHLGQRQPVRAHVEGRQPEQQPIAHERAAARSHGQEPEARLGGELRQHDAPRRRQCARGGAVEASARWLAHGCREHGCQREPGEPEDEEGRAPPEPMCEIAAEKDPEGAAEGDPEGEAADGTRAAARWKVVRQQRVHRGHSAGLADADHEARREQGDEAVHEAARGGGGAPQRECAGDDGHAAVAVSEPTRRDAKGGVEECQRRAAHKADFGVGQVQLGLHGADQDPKSHAVDEIEGVHHHQHRDDIDAVERTRRGGRADGGSAHGPAPAAWACQALMRSSALVRMFT